MRSSTTRRPATEDHGVLEVGKTRIPYRVRTSLRSKHKRIIVAPGSVEVVLPESEPLDGAHAFVHAKRRWVFNQASKLGEVRQAQPSYESGTKVRFRGRWLTIEVRRGQSNEASVSYRSRFYITLPRGVPRTERAEVTKALLDAWLRIKLLEDGHRFARRYGEKAGVVASGVKIIGMKRTWASCGKDQIIRLNADLIQLPRAIVEYAIAHEVAHLVHRNHSPAFWRMVGALMPDWRERQEWLDRFERRLEL